MPLTQDQKRVIAERASQGRLTPQQTDFVRRMVEKGELPRGILQPSPIGDRGQEIRDIGRDVLEIGGGIAGALTPQGRIAQGVRGLLTRGVGAAGGQAGGAVISEQFDPTVSPASAALRAAVEGAAGEAAATTLGGITLKLLKPLRGKLEEGAEQTLEQLSRSGVTPTPGQLSTSRLLDISENVAEASLLGGGRISAVRQRGVDAAEADLRAFSERFAQSGNKEQIGSLIQDSIEEGSTAFRALARTKYARVDELTRGVNVNISSIKRRASELENRLTLRKGSSVARGVLKDIQALPDNVPFSTAQDLRSDLLAIGRSSQEVVQGKTQGMAKLLAKDVDTAISGASDNLSGDGLRAFQEANRFFRQGKETFNDRLIVRLARQSPDAVFDAAIKAKKPAQIRKVMNVLRQSDDPALLESVKGRLTEDLMERATNQTGQLSGQRLLGQLQRFGDDALGEVYTQSELTALKANAKALERVQSKASVAGEGRIFIQLTQAGAILGLVTGQFEAASTVLLLGPVALSRFLTNKGVSRWLTVGLNAPRGSTQFNRAMGQVATIASKSGAIPLDEAQRLFSETGFGREQET